MITQRLSVELPLFLIRVATVSFFSIGFVQYFQRVWYDAFENLKTPRLFRYLRRGILFAITTGLGLAIQYGAMVYIHNNSAILYHNWALFVLTLPLLFPGFRKFESSCQLLALLWIWYLHHQPNFWEPTTLAGLVGFFGIVLVLKHFSESFKRHWLAGVIMAFLLASCFWLTAPRLSMGMAISPEMAVEAVLLHTLMIVFVLGYWLRQYREDQLNRQRERLAEYEKGSHEHSYANNQQKLQSLLISTQAQGETLSFATLDLDHFQKVNHRFGHLAGSAVLIGVKETLETVLDNAAVPYQLYQPTGEEFNLVFPMLDPEAALPIITACWQAVRKGDYSYDGRTIDVTLSIGLTGLKPEDNSVNDLYKRADDALSKAKRSGRDAITLDDKVVSGAERSEKRLADYQYFAQGIHDLSQPDLPKVYHELLLRTYDPLLKRWILPDSFEIPAWMSIALLQDFMQYTALQNFNLNLTADQFADIDIANALTQFAESPEGPANLTVEIMDLADSQTTRRISALYRAAGIKIMIDDVGSDNTYEQVRNSLPYINGIKFAMQNLRKTLSETELEERVSFWQQIASENQLMMILEGVETEADLELARRLGIQYLQGYYFNKPAQAEQRQAN